MAWFMLPPACALPRQITNRDHRIDSLSRELSEVRSKLAENDKAALEGLFVIVALILVFVSLNYFPR